MMSQYLSGSVTPTLCHRLRTARIEKLSQGGLDLDNGQPEADATMSSGFEVALTRFDEVVVAQVFDAECTPFFLCEL